MMLHVVSVLFLSVVASASAAIAETRSMKCTSISLDHPERELSVQVNGASVAVQLNMESKGSDPIERQLVYFSQSGMNSPQGSNIQFFVLEEVYGEPKARSQVFVSVDWANVTASIAFVNMIGLLFADSQFDCRRLD
jgi:hypothetical protein